MQTIGVLKTLAKQDYRHKTIGELHGLDHRRETIGELYGRDYRRETIGMRLSASLSRHKKNNYRPTFVSAKPSAKPSLKAKIASKAHVPQAQKL